MTCPNCHGTRRVSSGAACIECAGSGRVSREAGAQLAAAGEAALPAASAADDAVRGLLDVRAVNLATGRRMRFELAHQDGRTYYRLLCDERGGGSLTDFEHAVLTVEYWRAQGWLLPRCPDCGGVVELVRAADGGAIEETVWTQGGLRRKVRPATYHACTGCEFCTEEWEGRP